MEHGIPGVAAAGMLAAMGNFDILGTTFSGWLLLWYYGLREKQGSERWRAYTDRNPCLFGDAGKL